MKYASSDINTDENINPTHPTSSTSLGLSLLNDERQNTSSGLASTSSDVTDDNAHSTNMISFSPPLDLRQNNMRVRACKRRLPSPALRLTEAPAAKRGHKCEGELNCHIIKFGELYGKVLEPIRIEENRIYFKLICNLAEGNYSGFQNISFSLGQNDIDYIKCNLVNPVLAIRVSQRFAEVTCERIGKDALDPTSSDPKKQYIILTMPIAATYRESSTAFGLFCSRIIQQFKSIFIEENQA